MFARRLSSRPHGESGVMVPVRRDRFLPIFVAAFLGGLATIGVYLLSNAAEHRVATLEFHSRSKEHLSIINTDMQDAFSLLGSLRVLFESSTQPVDRGEFGRFSARLHVRAIGLRDAGWAPHIDAADRAGFERAIQSSGYPGFEIRDRTPDGRLVRAGARADYYPILYQDPPNGPARPLLGLDLMTGPDGGAALRRAIETNAPAATAPLRLVSMDRRPGIYCYLPVRRGAAAMPQAMRVDGIVFGAFDLVPMLDHIIADKRRLTGLNLYIFNPAGRADDRLIYWWPATSQARSPPGEAHLRALPHFEGTVGAIDHDLGALFLPVGGTPGGISRLQEIGPSLACLVLTVVTITYLLFSLRSRVKLEVLSSDLRQTTTRLLGEQDRIAHMAGHDALTGLPNRRRFGEVLNGIITRSAQDNTACAILLIDLDRFKPINDFHGHAVGDAVLCEVASRLHAIIRKDTIAARLGGDEFAIIIEGLGSDFQKIGEAVALRMIAALSAPIATPQATVAIGATIGIAFYPADGSKPEQVLHAADLAMYGAKRRERGTLGRFEAGMDLLAVSPERPEPDPRQTLTACDMQACS